MHTHHRHTRILAHTQFPMYFNEARYFATVGHNFFFVYTLASLVIMAMTTPEPILVVNVMAVVYIETGMGSKTTLTQCMLAVS